MIRNFTVAIVCGLAILLVGCQEIKREFSETMHEDAIISEVVYTPSRHSIELGFTAFKAGSVGVDFSGDLGFRLGESLQVSSVKVPEKFAVVFKCQHGQFIISGKEVYDKLREHKSKMVEVAYREVYRTTYDTKGGKKQVIARELVDYDFLDATLKY